MTYKYNAMLSRLVGCHLQSVHLAGVYTQFTFSSLCTRDRPVLTCEVMPVLDLPNGPVASGHPGYADAVHALIGHHVVGTHEAPRDGLRIEFAEAVLALRPTADDLHSPVIATLSDFGDGSSVSWWPSSAAFAYLG